MSRLIEPPTAKEIDEAAEAVMRARIQYGWTFGKRPKVLAIDLIMAEAALRTLSQGENK